MKLSKPLHKDVEQEEAEEGSKSFIYLDNASSMNEEDSCERGDSQSFASEDELHQQDEYDGAPQQFEAQEQLQSFLEDIMSDLESAKEAYQSQFMDSFNGFCEVQQEMQFIIEDETREADEYLHLAQEREKEVEANLKRVRDTRARMNKRVRT